MIKSDNGAKNPVGRPSKLTKELLDKLKQLTERPSFVVFTDEDICTYLDIDKQTKNNWLNSEYKDEAKEEFFALIKRARVLQKQNLADQMLIGDNGWQSKSWMLERKFDDCNLKLKSEIHSTNHNYNSDLPLEPNQVKTLLENLNARQTTTTSDL